jgi:hypothetical protein
LPKGWTLDLASAEPFIGTGPYRIIREQKDWYLVKNKNYLGTETNPTQSADNSAVEKWKILFNNDFTQDVDKLTIPDFMPVVVGEQISALNKFPQKIDSHHVVLDQTSFLQSTAWWIQESEADLIGDAQKIKMQALAELLESARIVSGNGRATGVVPKGVAGHIPESVNPPKPIQLTAFKNKQIFKVGVYQSVKKVFDLSKDLKNIESKYNLEFKFVTSPGDPAILRESKVDAVVVAYFGGFNDPQGFTFMLEKVVGKKIEQYLGTKLGSKYLLACKQIDPVLRSKMFLEFGEQLLASGKFVPGWTFKVVSVNSKKLSYKNTQRYSPRFTDVKVLEN